MQQRFSLVLALALIPAGAGCAALDEPSSVQAAEAPLAGSGGDASDRACQIVLRQLARPVDGPGWLTNGTSWVWDGVLEVAAEAEAAGAVPAVLYQAGSDPTWWQVAAVPAEGAPAGYARYAFRLDQHLPGPGMSGTAITRAEVQVIPVLLLPSGGRLFDHNRHPGDFDNYVLAYPTGFAVDDEPAVCPASAAPAPGLVPGWIGNAAVRFTRSSDDACDGGAPLAEGFFYGTWTRTRAAIRNACFEAWAPGVTDWDNPELWKQLDVRVHYRFDDGDFAWQYVNLDRRVGNNARYAFDLSFLDPFRPYRCPDVPVTDNGAYVSAEAELYFSVNGVELRPAGSGSTYAGTFEDYAGDYWRETYCN